MSTQPPSNSEKLVAAKKAGNAALVKICKRITDKIKENKEGSERYYFKLMSEAIFQINEKNWLVDDIEVKKFFLTIANELDKKYPPEEVVNFFKTFFYEFSTRDKIEDKDKFYRYYNELILNLGEKYQSFTSTLFSSKEFEGARKLVKAEKPVSEVGRDNFPQPLTGTTRINSNKNPFYVQDNSADPAGTLRDVYRDLKLTNENGENKVFNFKDKNGKIKHIVFGLSNEDAKALVKSGKLKDQNEDAIENTENLINLEDLIPRKRGEYYIYCLHQHLGVKKPDRETVSKLLDIIFEIDSDGNPKYRTIEAIIEALKPKTIDTKFLHILCRFQQGACMPAIKSLSNFTVEIGDENIAIGQTMGAHSKVMAIQVDAQGEPSFIYNEIAKGLSSNISTATPGVTDVRSVVMRNGLLALENPNEHDQYQDLIKGYPDILKIQTKVSLKRNMNGTYQEQYDITYNFPKSILKFDDRLWLDVKSEKMTLTLERMKNMLEKKKNELEPNDPNITHIKNTLAYIDEQYKNIDNIRNFATIYNVIRPSFNAIMRNYYKKEFQESSKPSFLARVFGQTPLEKIETTVENLDKKLNKDVNLDKKLNTGVLAWFKSLLSSRWFGDPKPEQQKTSKPQNISGILAEKFSGIVQEHVAVSDIIKAQDAGLGVIDGTPAAPAMTPQSDQQSASSLQPSSLASVEKSAPLATEPSTTPTSEEPKKTVATQEKPWDQQPTIKTAKVAEIPPVSSPVLVPSPVSVTSSAAVPAPASVTSAVPVPVPAPAPITAVIPTSVPGTSHPTKHTGSKNA